MTESPHPSARPSKAQRRFLTAVAGMAVTALAGGAFVLSYEDLRGLALYGGAPRRYASLYAGMLDGLVVVTVLAVLMARRSGWWTRTLRWLLLLTLVAGAGAAGVQRAVKGYDALPRTWVEGGVAAAPWAILLIAIWLWVAMIKQTRRLLARRGEPSPASETEPEDTVQAIVDEPIIPGFDEEPTEVIRPALALAVEPAPGAFPGRSTAGLSAGRPADGEPAAAVQAVAEPPAAEAVARPWPANPAPAEPAARAATTARARADTAVAEPEDTEDRSGEPASPAAQTVPPEPDHDGAEETESEPEAEDEDDVESDEHDVEPRPPSQDAATDDAATGPVVRDSLPTDVVVARPRSRPPATHPDGIRVPTTHPDGIGVQDTRPDGIPIVTASDPGDDDPSAADDRADDADAGDPSSEGTPWGDEDGQQPSGTDRPVAGPPKRVPDSGDATPPSSTFRSSPTPPRD